MATRTVDLTSTSLDGEKNKILGFIFFSDSSCTWKRLYQVLENTFLSWKDIVAN